MTQRLWHENKILAALAAGAAVVAASERLVRSVRLAHADAARTRGARVWERAEVLNWNAFLHTLYVRHQETVLQPAPRLLTLPQVEVLWENVIHAQQEAGTLLQLSAAARAAANAAAACQAYGISLVALEQDPSAGDDARQFARWLHTYIDRCESEKLLDPSRLPEYLVDIFKQSKAILPKQLICIGFDELTPQQQRFLDVISKAGTQVEHVPAGGENQTRSRHITCADAQAEREAAARWARALLEREPKARIGIVVRDLDEQRQALARTLDRILCPGMDYADLQDRPYNLSLGRALTDCPVVSDALSWLHCLQWRLPFAQMSRLLRSPFLVAGESEAAARARLEIKLRDANLDQVGLARLSDMAQRSGEVPALQAVLQAVMQLLREIPTRQLPSQWAKSFAALLSASGWPGERTPDSEEYQAVTVLRELLGEFAQLDAVMTAVNADDALTRFTRMAGHREFQPAIADVPLQVLGVPETAGQRFDYLWIMGLTEDVWPASPRPDPFIPRTLQRKHQLPHASAALELQHATRITRRLLMSATDVMVSTAERDADTELRPSPLLAEIEPGELANVTQSPVAIRQQQLQQEAATALEEFSDRQGPLLAGGVTAGGTRILKAQAACPFQAFAVYRLHAQPLVTPSPGLSPAERGLLLHSVMEEIWKRLREHARLVQMQSDERQQLITECVDRVLQQIATRQPDAFTQNFRRLEQLRLTRLVDKWLELETERTSFSVEQPEQERVVRLGALELKTRVDRIDRLTEGARVLIDYKSGEADPKNWTGARPDEPQLPIYAVTAEQPPAAVLFAQLRTGDLCYRGFAERGGLVPGIGSYAAPRNQPDAPQDWHELLAHWQTAVTALAEEFVHGEARVEPQHGDNTCRFCHLQALCRIHTRDGLKLEDTDGQD